MDKQPQNTIENKETIRIPEVNFAPLPLEYQQKMIFAFCNVKNSGEVDFSGSIYRHHPELKSMVKEVIDENEFRQISDKYVEDCVEKNKEEIEEASKRFKNSWDQVSEKFFTEITKDFEVNTGDLKDKIIASVSINPVCPRFIKEWSFHLFYKLPEREMKKVTIHEIIHFIYFKKWQEVFPQADPKTFSGASNPEWVLSEILVHPIINNNEVIQNILDGYQTDVYKPWEKAEIDGKKLIEYFGEFYKEHKEGKISFADFLKKSWEEYQKNRELIEGQIKNK